MHCSVLIITGKLFIILTYLCTFSLAIASLPVKYFTFYRRNQLSSSKKKLDSMLYISSVIWKLTANLLVINGTYLDVRYNLLKPQGAIRLFVASSMTRCKVLIGHIVAMLAKSGIIMITKKQISDFTLCFVCFPIWSYVVMRSHLIAAAFWC